MEYINKLAELIQHNSVDTLEYIEDLNEMREIQQGISNNSELRKQYYNMLNSFYFSNGIFNKINHKYLNDEQRTYLSLWSQQLYQPTNRHRQQILKYYSEHLEDIMGDVNLEHISDNFANQYYSMIPGLNAGYSKYQVKPMVLKTGPNHISNYIPMFIKIGECLQFDVEGFPRNESLYLLYGMAVYFASLQEFKSFRSLINYLQSFIQLNLLSKCFNSYNLSNARGPGNGPTNGNSPNAGWNLITFIEFKHGPITTENYRYKTAKKYIEKNKRYGTRPYKDDRKHWTKLVDDDKGLYILTEMSKEDIDKAWAELEDLYKKKMYDTLINDWFDSQLMTRSTCLIGCMLIMILKHKLIKFSKNEMPDWKAILEGSYAGTYEEVGPLPTGPTLKIISLNDVLLTLYNYYQLSTQN